MTVSTPFSRYIRLLLKKAILWVFLALDAIAFLSQYLPLVFPGAPAISLPPILYWLIALVGLLWAGYQVYREQPSLALEGGVPAQVARDSEFFERLLRILPASSFTISQLREYDFGGTFDLQWFEPLWDFEEKCKQPDFAFVDPDLEAGKLELLNRTREFLDAVRSDTVPLPNPHRPLQSIDKVIQQSDPEAYARLRQNLNSRAQALVDTYDSLVRSARSKLPPPSASPDANIGSA